MLKEAIQKAIEGGYVNQALKVKSEYAIDFRDLRGGQLEIYNKMLEEYLTTKAFLDPLFWQCLGKGLRWRPVEWEVLPYIDVAMSVVNSTPVKAVCREKRTEGYIYHWHRFIEHIANGGNVEEFFINLLKNK